MAGSPKEKLQTEETASTEASEDREVYMRDGRKVVVSEGLVEIRSPSGMLEVRIKLTEEGPVLQMESVRMQLKAEESVQIEGKRVEIKSEEDLDIESQADVRVRGAKIFLN